MFFFASLGVPPPRGSRWIIGLVLAYLGCTPTKRQLMDYWFSVSVVRVYPHQEAVNDYWFSVSVVRVCPHQEGVDGLLV